MNRPDVEHQWLFDRCREVQAEMNGVLDLWAREHYKSTIITFAGSIFRIIRSHGEDAPEEREVTIGIFSNTKALAKKFLSQIKVELETNDHLKYVFDDIFFEKPQKQSPKWTLDEGIQVKRETNPKENTIEAHGMVDGLPTGPHFGHLMYDDVVVKDSVNTPDQIKRTTEAYEHSTNLGSDGGTFSMAGTIYNFGDTYMQLKKRGAVKTRVYPCTHDGEENFEPENCVLQSPQYLRDKRVAQGPYTFGTQMLLNPRGDSSQSFNRDWLKYETVLKTHGLNVYISVDPANEKRKHNDYSTYWVVGVDGNRNMIVLDVIRDRFNLAERVKTLFDLHQKWSTLGRNPVKIVFYEHYGIQADIQVLEMKMTEYSYRFAIQKMGGTVPKPDRIKRLIPYFEQGKIILPNSRTYTDYESTTMDLIDVFREEEYSAFPALAHDDMLDGLARFVDPEANMIYPKFGTSTANTGNGVVVKTGNSRLDSRNNGTAKRRNLDHLHGTG